MVGPAPDDMSCEASEFGARREGGRTSCAHGRRARPAADQPCQAHLATERTSRRRGWRLVVEATTDSFLKALPVVEALGFDYRPQNTFVGSPDHLFFRRVKNGKRTPHLHVVRLGSPEIDENRRFRDALRQDPAFAREDESFKLELGAQHGIDRMRYVEVRSDWVDERVASLPPTSP